MPVHTTVRSLAREAEVRGRRTRDEAETIVDTARDLLARGGVQV